VLLQLFIDLFLTALKLADQLGLLSEFGLYFCKLLGLVSLLLYRLLEIGMRFECFRLLCLFPVELHLKALNPVHHFVYQPLLLLLLSFSFGSLFHFKLSSNSFFLGSLFRFKLFSNSFFLGSLFLFKLSPDSLFFGSLFQLYRLVNFLRASKSVITVVVAASFNFFVFSCVIALIAVDAT